MHLYLKNERLNIIDCGIMYRQSRIIVRPWRYNLTTQVCSTYAAKPMNRLSNSTVRWRIISGPLPSTRSYRIFTSIEALPLGKREISGNPLPVLRKPYALLPRTPMAISIAAPHLFNKAISREPLMTFQMSSGFPQKMKMPITGAGFAMRKLDDSARQSTITGSFLRFLEIHKQGVRLNKN